MHKDLLNLLRDVENISIRRGPAEGCLIGAVCEDSRKAKPGSIFFALPGTGRQGTDFIRQAVAQGATAVVVPKQFEKMAGKDVPEQVVLLSSGNPRAALGQIASAFYGHPSRTVQVIGITGTNGKTTTSFFMERILQCAGKECGLSGTIVQKAGRSIKSSSLTTPDAISFQAFLAGLSREGIKYAVTEVSSHGLSQGRVEGCRFSAAVFTNLSHDHLDYHGDMENYFQAKRFLFSRHRPDFSAFNLDDPYGRRLWQEHPGRKISYGLSQGSMVTASDYSFDKEGIKAVIRLRDERISIDSPFIGLHNLYNILAAAAAAYVLDIPAEHIRKGIEAVRKIPGRLERVAGPRDITALVDYAHTPDALKNVLECLKKLTSGRLITVVGCGGDRDRTKRSEMAEIAAGLSDLSVFTSDNPRTESAEGIIEDMLKVKGLSPGLHKKIKVIIERREAISWAACRAAAGDILLVAGKGHEDYQIIGRKRFPFDDRKVLEDALKRKQFSIRPRRRGKAVFFLGDVKQALSAELTPEAGDITFSSVCTDTRKICPGQLFWALRGENFDGHLFVKTAARKKAAGAVVEYVPEGLPETFPLLRVRDSLHSLGEFAGWYKRLLGYRVFGITGSCGKTTTKELVASVLMASYAAAKTTGNFNNLIGLPLSMLAVAPGTEWAVLEMGTNLPGEIERLCEIARPEAGLVTCIRPVHLEGLGSIENIAREKAALLRNLPETGTAVINLDDPWIRRFLPGLRCRNLTGYTCEGLEPGRSFPNLVSLKGLSHSENGLDLELEIAGKSVRFNSRLSGRVNAVNIMAAVATGVAFGIDMGLIKKGIEKVGAPSGRMHREKLCRGWLLVDDSYNANPSSVKAAIETLSEMAGESEKTLVIGEMLELGPGAKDFHWKTGVFAAANDPGLLITVGRLAEYMAEGALSAGLSQKKVLSFASTGQLLDWLSADDAGFFNGSRRAVLVKGSRGVGLEKVVRFIKERVQQKEIGGGYLDAFLPALSPS